MLVQHLFVHSWLKSAGLCLHARIQLRRYGTAVIRDILKLHDRGIFQTILPEMSAPELARKLSSPQTVYCGFDPTADSLHIGNLLAIVSLLHCQRAGHTPIALIGGATAHIGDPSGKTKDREPISAEIVEQNILGLTENLERIFTNHELFLWKDQRPLPKVRILNNATWYRDKNVVDFLSGVGRYFRMGSMLAKHSVKSRLATREGMSFTEFTYQIFQAYDWLHLVKNHDCCLQLGGNDQIGNITAGIDFIDRAVKERVYGLTIPLVTTSGGNKIGKSEGNAVWLDPYKTTPYELYQYFINTPDDDVATYLRLFTFIPDSDIDTMMRNHTIEPSKRVPQKLLADKVTVLVHGEDGLKEAKKWTEAFFSNDPSALMQLTGTDLQRLFKNAPTIDIPFQHDLSLLDLIMKSKSFNRAVDALRVIRAGGVYVNHVRHSDPDRLMVLGEHILPNDITLLRVGKKNYHIIRWISLS